MSIDDRIFALTAFLKTRWLTANLTTRGSVLRYQKRKLDRMLAKAIPGVGFYRDLPISLWDHMPIMDKQLLLANFARLNRPGITVDQVRSALQHGEERVNGYVVGQSTGTSGNRGYYVISDRERFVWLGTILAKALPNALWSRHRVALALPGLPSLYQSAATGSRISIKLFDLSLGVDSWIERFAAFEADTVVAPPKVLRYLAEHGKLPARNIFSGAEVLDPKDREIIEAVTGQKVREIYMATEGLFGVACNHGTLHLAEDVVAFEWQPIGEGSPLVTPLVTDFTRETQVMARYRMNDLMELSDICCPCGSAFQAIARIDGRQDDVFHLPGNDGRYRLLTPDVLRNAVVDAHPLITDFRVVQTAADRIEVSLDESLSEDVDTLVIRSLSRLFERTSISPVTITVKRGLDVPYDRKLRRVRCAWKAD